MIKNFFSRGVRVLAAESLLKRGETMKD